MEVYLGLVYKRLSAGLWRATTVPVHLYHEWNLRACFETITTAHTEEKLGEVTYQNLEHLSFLS
jgi:hypothetical protein